jgi:hypothetical protein
MSLERAMDQVPEGWWWSGLPGLAATSTYELVPLERLPHLDPSWVRGLDWIPSVEAPLDWSISDRDDAAAFLQEAIAAGVVVPDSFRSFISTPRFRWAIRSGTGCWWSLGEGRGVAARAMIEQAVFGDTAIEDPGPMAFVPGLGCYVVRFLTDQQDCLFWFLALGEPEGPVLVSDRDITEDPRDTTEDIWKVATTFGEFLHRFWIENEISFRTEEKAPLAPEQQAYLAEALRLGGK